MNSMDPTKTEQSEAPIRVVVWWRMVITAPERPELLPEPSSQSTPR